jgi:uridine kinase
MFKLRHYETDFSEIQYSWYTANITEADIIVLQSVHVLHEAQIKSYYFSKNLVETQKNIT